jgi:hypothetical protein
MIRQKTMQPKHCRVLVAVRFPEALTPITMAATGSYIVGGGKFFFPGLSDRVLFAFVEMFMTTSTAELTGVTGITGS